MIEFAGVTKIYNNTTAATRTEALRDVSLKIADGEFVYIIGPNGSGKSTLIKLINCEERVTSGKITLDEFKLHKIRRRQIPYLRRAVGMVFQDFNLIDNMTVYDNVAFALRVTDGSAREIRQKVPKILELMGLTKKARCKPTELSGGEQQKVGIARALVGNPRVLIADEPTGNVDPEMSNEILEILDEISKTGTTVIMVTHQREFIKKMPRRVIMLDNGVVTFDEDLSMAEYAQGQVGGNPPAESESDILSSGDQPDGEQED